MQFCTLRQTFTSVQQKVQGDSRCSKLAPAQVGLRNDPRKEGARSCRLLARFGTKQIDRAGWQDRMDCKRKKGP